MLKRAFPAQCIILRWIVVLLLFYALLLIVPVSTSASASATRNNNLDEYGRTPLSKNITAILDRLVDKTTYDKRLRPNYGGEPVEVGITIYVSSISAVSEVEMDYTVDFYLRQTWKDPRLRYAHMGSDDVPTLTVGWDYTAYIWLPDTFFPNEKKSTFHVATTHNSFLRISADGVILTSQRLTVTASCAMNLLLFPLDSQECTLEIESYGYAESDIVYNWQENNKVGVDKEAHTLPQFDMKNYTTSRRVITLSTGNYSRLNVRFVFARSIGFYLMQIYLPSMLIVIISWVSFWLHRDASPARVALGVTTVLTMTTLMTTTNAQMPKVSYIKSIDIYLGASFVMVFASLLEYAAVSYLNKKMKMKRERKKQQEASQVQEFPMMPSTSKTSPGTFNMEASGASFYPYAPSAQPDYQQLLPGTLNTTPFTHLECDCDLGARPVPLKITRPRLRRRRIHGVTPSTIDKYSRALFPITFIGFNAVYWTAYYFGWWWMGSLSYGYSTDDIKLVWLKGAQNSTDVDDTVKELPTFELAAYWGSETTQVLSTGAYSRLSCSFRFKRNIGFYWIQIYQPSMMVVIISWVAFWINRDSAPARVTLGIMTVLTMTTLMTTTNRQMPKVSYIKAVDIYLGVCYIMVFAALLEYAAVSYSNKKIQDRKKKRQTTQASTAGEPPPSKPPAITTPTVAGPLPVGAIAMDPNANVAAAIPSTSAGAPGEPIGGSQRFQTPYWNDRAPPDVLGLTKTPIHTMVTMGPPAIEAESSVDYPGLRLFNFPRFRNRSKSNAAGGTSAADKKLQQAASGIDKYSRIAFPGVFAIFNIIYWTVYLKKSGKI